MATSYLTKIFSSDSNLDKWTLSMWVKRAGIGNNNALYGTYINGSNEETIQFRSSDDIIWENYQSGSTKGKLLTNRLFRDPAAWYHLVFVWDSANATAGDRMKMYVNGVEEGSVGGYATDTNPTSGQDSLIGNTYTQQIGANGQGNNDFEGCMSHIHFCDGYAYAASDFGSFDATSGIWKIKTAPSVSYGTNGYFILKDGAVVTDSSPNSNNWTIYEYITATYDNPSNNFATLNSISPTSAALDLKNANTCSSGPNSSNYWQSVPSTLGASAGKWYFEFKDENAWGSTSDSTRRYGICDLNNIVQILSSAGDVRFSSSTAGYAYMNASGVRHNASTIAGTTSTYPTFVPGDILMCAMDLDNGKLYFGKNGTWNDSADPTSGATGTGSVADISTTATWSPYVETHYGSDVVSVNYGNGYFRTTAITSAGTNAGVGEFEYDVPTGYYALCTKNIKAYG